MAEPDIDLALKVIQRALKEKGRSQAWLGAEVARLEGRENPYTQASVSAWLVKIGEQLAGRIFSIEDALDLKGEPVARALGFIRATSRPLRSVEEAIEADPSLSADARRILIAALRSARLG